MQPKSSTLPPFVPPLLFFPFAVSKFYRTKLRLLMSTLQGLDYAILFRFLEIFFQNQLQGHEEDTGYAFPCVTTGCKWVQEVVGTWKEVNSSVPCDDFYAHVCGVRRKLLQQNSVEIFAHFMADPRHRRQAPLEDEQGPYASLLDRCLRGWDVVGLR